MALSKHNIQTWPQSGLTERQIVGGKPQNVGLSFYSNPMLAVKVCAWCPGFDRTNQAGHSHVSHSICPSCSALMEAQGLV